MIENSPWAITGLRAVHNFYLIRSPRNLLRSVFILSHLIDEETEAQSDCYM